jgi:hypothetical protein
MLTTTHRFCLVSIDSFSTIKLLFQSSPSFCKACAKHERDIPYIQPMSIQAVLVQ